MSLLSYSMTQQHSQLKIQNVISLSIQHDYSNDYYHLKYIELQSMKDEFDKLRQSVTSLIQHGKEVSNSTDEHIQKLKEFVNFILEQLQLKQYHTLDYICEYVRKNKTIFNIQQHYQDDCCCEGIVVDNDFWEHENNFKSHYYSHSLSLVNQLKNKYNYFITKELEMFIIEKMKSFVLT